MRNVVKVEKVRWTGRFVGGSSGSVVVILFIFL